MASAVCNRAQMMRTTSRTVSSRRAVRVEAAAWTKATTKDAVKAAGGRLVVEVSGRSTPPLQLKYPLRFVHFVKNGICRVQPRSDDEDYLQDCVQQAGRACRGSCLDQGHYQGCCQGSWWQACC
mmetsp:Transcript_6407/g.14252  ORF Transcript_6407/g.14252 Transcript_6407/m.14252 type:complete len:124 (-) Transcript_6407:12-383(-)